jgi:hypothetical protein
MCGITRLQLDGFLGTFILGLGGGVSLLNFVDQIQLKSEKVTGHLTSSPEYLLVYIAEVYG